MDELTAIIAEARRLFEHLMDYCGYSESQAAAETDRYLEDNMPRRRRYTEPYRGQTCPTSGPVSAWLRAEFVGEGV